MKKLIIFILLFIVIVVLSVVSYNLFETNKLAEKENAAYQLEVRRIQDSIRQTKALKPKNVKKQSSKKVITINAKDEYGYLIGPINVWKNYDSRTFAFSLNHGAKVTQIDKGGSWVKIKDSRGRVGYVTYWFIKEYK